MLRVPIIRILVYWCLYWGPLISGNYHLQCGVWGLSARGLRGSGAAGIGQRTGLNLRSSLVPEQNGIWGYVGSIQ